MSVAYVVLAHRGPAQLARLVGRLTEAGDTVVVHLDARTPSEPFREALDALGRRDLVHLLPRSQTVACHWGDISLVLASLNGVRHALTAAPEATHVVLLSGQDYPLKPVADIQQFFAADPDTSYLFYATDRGPEGMDRSGNAAWFWNGSMDRLDRFHVRIGRRWLALPNRFVPWWPRRSMPEGLRPAQGSQWWALHRPAAIHVLQRLTEEKQLRRFFRHVQIPDENAVHMVMDASSFRAAVVQDDLHWITWEREHPAILTEDDLPAMTASDKLFARKFDADRSPGVLDSLDLAHAPRRNQ